MSGLAPVSRLPPLFGRSRLSPDADAGDAMAVGKRRVQEHVRALSTVQKGSLRFLDSIVRPQGHKALGAAGFASLLGVSLDRGVSSNDVATRKEIFGFNSYKKKLRGSFGAFGLEMLQIVLMVWGAICCYVDSYEGLGVLWSIILVVMVTAASDYQQLLQFRDLDKEKEKITVQVTRDGIRQKILIYDLVVGDIVHLAVGDKVPADGILVSGYNLVIDQSSLTGEVEAIRVGEECPFLTYGSSVKDGLGKMLVTAVGMETEWGQLMVTLEKGGEDETPLQGKINDIKTISEKAGLVLAVFTWMVSIVRYLMGRKYFINFTWTDIVNRLRYFASAAISILLAGSEKLPSTFTLSTGFVAKRLNNKMAIIRRLSACESMGFVSCIAVDKTGVLTENYMEVEKIWICGFIRSANGNNRRGQRKLGVCDLVFSMLLQAIMVSCKAEGVMDEEGKSVISGTPMESAMLNLGLLLGRDYNTEGRLFEILKVKPFCSSRKKMSVLAALPGGGGRAFCKGSSEEVIRMCDSFVGRKGKVIALCEEQVTRIMDVINGFASAAMKTVCLAYKDLGNDASLENIPERGYILLAVLGIKNILRPEVKEAVKTCLEAGITVRMITGDDKRTAMAVARECGILTDDENAIEGPVFRSKPLDELKTLIPKIQVMACSSARDKYTLVTHLMLSGEVVAMTGDEISDSRALKLSNIGLARGISGTEVARENADVVIRDDSFSTIVNVVKWGRAVYVNIQKYVQFYLTVIFVALGFNFASACISGSTTLTVVQLIWINMILDPLAAWALTTESPTDELMQRPPVAKKANLITKAMWRNLVGQIIFQVIVLANLKLYGERLLGLTGVDTCQVLDTAIFNTFVFFQVFNEINCREIEKMNVFKGVFDNWRFVGVMVLTVALQVIIVEFLGAYAGTVALSWQLWLLSAGLGSLSMLIGALFKSM